ncbi:MAG: AMP-binding protein [Ignavibacteriales bacterium]|nr:AMP-binding protein [Ignavibacteriales bacterium]
MTALRHFETISELYLHLAQVRRPSVEKPAFYYNDGERYVAVSFDEFTARVESFGMGMRELGVERESIVAILAENRPEWIYADFATIGLGAADAPLYPSLTSDTVEYILRDSEAVGVVVSNKHQLAKVASIAKKPKRLKFVVTMNDEDAEGENVYSFSEVCRMGERALAERPKAFEEIAARAEPDEVASVIYTSGTTGEPKGVVLTHRNIMSNVRDAHATMPIEEGDRFLSFLPLCHIFERMAGYYTMFAGGVSLYHTGGVENVADGLQIIKPTIMTAVPRLFERIYSRVVSSVERESSTKRAIFRWAIDVGYRYHEARRAGAISPFLKARHKLADKLVLKKIRDRTGGKIKYFISGGAALPRELGEFFEAVGVLVLEGYGLTESSPVISVNRVDNYKFGSVGIPFPSVEVKIANDGEILARGPNVMRGYFRNKKETDKTIVDGWLHTGDVGMFDSDGFLFITDRKKHLFKTSAGKYIAPTPIENAFRAGKYIDQFVLIGERRTFLSALVVPDFEALKVYADREGIAYGDVADLTKRDEIYDLFEKEIAKLQKKLANYERVRKFAVLDKPFTVEDGEITPKLSVRRKNVEERYKHLIDEMYGAGLKDRRLP